MSRNLMRGWLVVSTLCHDKFCRRRGPDAGAENKRTGVKEMKHEETKGWTAERTQRDKNLPVDAACVLEQAQGDAVHGGITPPLVEEAAGPVEVVEVVLVGLAAPEGHVANLKIGPEVARRVAVGLLPVVGAADAVRQPVHSVVLLHVLGVLG